MQYLCPSCRSNLSANSMAIACANLTAQESVGHECTEMASKGSYSCIITSKPDNMIRIMYKNFSSLSLFAMGPMHHKKIYQLNKLMSNYGVDFLAGYETHTDWRFINEEDNKYCNLFGNGLLTRGVCASNINDRKVRHNQWGGTCISAVGQISAFVTEVEVDSTGLGRWSWMYVGGGGKQTHVILAYQPCNPKRRTTRGETVWDQHTRYFEVRGEVRDP
jgi:hypothetical protein